MVEIEVPVLKEFNTTNAKTLAVSVKNIQTFTEVEEWDNTATLEIEAMRTALLAIENKLADISQSLTLEQQSHESKTFLAKLFNGRKEQNQLLADQAHYVSEKNKLENLIDQFESAVDFTPDSPDDLKELIKDCKQLKKELQLEKKTIAADMAAVRVEARQKSTQVITGKYGKWDRRHIRLQKEAALRPQETEKAAIERRILKIEKIILWLERFK